MPAKPTPLQPTVTVLCKLGSIAVHVEEMLGPKGHSFDRVALESLLTDPEISAWLKQMDELAMLPKKR